MEETKFPIDFLCPICKSKETVAQAACKKEKDEGRISPEAFVSLEKMTTPLIGDKPPVGLTVRGLLAHYDVCLNCGMRYCTRVEIITIPVTVTAPKGFPPTQPPFGKG